MGIVIYLMGFIVEPTGPRWNLETFLNSYFSACLLGIIPFTFFVAINYPYLSLKIYKDSGTGGKPDYLQQPPEELLKISSQLKKEELSFYPSQFLFAESDGNYVIFYLESGNQVRKQMLRNSIRNIEHQLSVVPYFIRIHRSFIVNLKKVKSKQGNILGYQLKLVTSDFKIPVSRNKIRIFDEVFERFKSR
jgi:DNA-binding LytR/AlgR family response regulator